MRFTLGCLLSALLASLTTVWLMQPRSASSQAFAQQRASALPDRPSGPVTSQPPDWADRTNERVRRIETQRPQSAPSTEDNSKPRADANPTDPKSLSPEPYPILMPPEEIPPQQDKPKSPAEPPADSSPSSSNSISNGVATTDANVPVGVRVYEKCNRGVVNITSRGLPGDRFFFMEVRTEGSGSGIVLDRQGHILTNYHVVENAQQVEVGLYDGSSYPATFVGADPIYDLAIIKIDAPPEKLFPISLGDSGQLKVGMRVFAIGNPFGLERTMTEGIVSSVNRTLEIRGRNIKAIIQTDAAINPGNSGGPLLNVRGELVGVNTAIATSAGQSAGVALAIPSSLVKRVVPQLIQHGHVIRPEIGIQQVLETDHGLRIAKLTPGGPAARAGLRGPKVTSIGRGPIVFNSVDRLAADMIIAVDGEKVTTADEFLSLVERNKPGDTVMITVKRGEETKEIPVVLGGGLSQPAAGRPRPTTPEPQSVQPRPSLDPIPQR